MRRLLTLFLALAGTVSAQTVNHGFGYGTSNASAAWANPQATGDTLLVAVTPTGGTLTDAAGDAFVQDCTQGSFAIHHAPAQIFAANVVTYSLAGQSVALWASEQTGGFKLDVCGTGAASTTSNGAAVPVSAQATATPQQGDLAYAFLVDSPGKSDILAASGFSVINGTSAPYWGVGAYTGSYLDAVGTGTVAAFLLEPGTGANSATLMEAWYSPVSGPQPVTLNLSGSVAYDDGSSPFGQTGITFSVLEQEGSAWVSVGTPSIAPNGTVSGTVTVNPNFTTQGAVFFEVAIAGLPVFYSAGLDPRTFEQGSTNMAINVVLFKSILSPKSFSLALTP
jgi:hypothetical protein